MKLVKILLLVPVVSFFTISSVLAESFDFQWVSGANKSCYQICDQQGYRPFTSGRYKNGEDFYICSANANGEGFRAGYNLAPTWDHQCVVGYGGKETSVNQFNCLCVK